jgi:hypothetical protein
MKTCEYLPKDVPQEIEISVASKVGKRLKKFMYITGLAGITLCFNACVPGYIATEPSYVEYTRPQQPSPLHIWIDGDWLFNRQSHTYVQKVGYWEKPNQRRTYVSGHWQKTPRGNYWSTGHWQRQGHRNH